MIALIFLYFITSLFLSVCVWVYSFLSEKSFACIYKRNMCVIHALVVIVYPIKCFWYLCMWIKPIYIVEIFGDSLFFLPFKTLRKSLHSLLASHYKGKTEIWNWMFLILSWMTNLICLDACQMGFSPWTLRLSSGYIYLLLFSWIFGGFFELIQFTKPDLIH